jgi:type IV secretory pathway TraG/TraD family ATPase VirD4
LRWSTLPSHCLPPITSIEQRQNSPCHCLLNTLLGFHSAYTSSQTFHNGEETSQSKSEHPIYLLSSQEILQMSDDEIIVFYGDLLPFRDKRMDWRRFPVLKRQCNLTPPALPLLPELEEIQLATDQPQTQPAAFTYISPNGL